jgi:Flp pilus assembly protein TadD/mono/diheme cytochrome c family protein
MEAIGRSRMRGYGLAAQALLLTIAELSAAAAQPVTFHRQIAPILFEYCAPCHRPGEAGPFPLLTYEDARKRAAQIATVTRRRYMPPWLPEPGYGVFANQQRLSDAQIQLIENWAATGAGEGAVSDSPRPPKFTPGWQLGPPDLIVKVAKPFSVPADGPDVFWNFLLPAAVGEIRYVKAIEIRPGNARSVHHANLLLDRARSSRRQEKTPGEGFPGMDLTLETETFDPDSHFLFWKPGGAPRIEPDGMAWRLDPGNDLVLNVHFHPTGKPELAQPSIGLYFTDKPQSKFPMLVQIERDRALNIAPGMRDFVVSDDFRLPLDVDAIAVYPHAHYLGTLLEGYATLPDGSRRWLIRIPRWDINWQAVYRYRQPLFLPKGSVISMRFHYDNSAENPRNPNTPPKRVVGGNQSTDEMGHLWLQVLPRGGDQRAVLQEALMRHRLENDPANFSAHFNLGVLLLGRKDASSAITHLRESLRLEPEQPLAVNDLGAALELEGRVEDALEQFRSALRLQPDYTNARFNLASGLAAQGKLEEAAANFRQVLTTVPEDRAAREQLVAVLIRTGNAAATEGRLSAAAASYRELVTLRPADADLRNNLGILLARSGDFASAAEQFEAALKSNPSHQTARRNLELVRDRLAQH